MCREHYNELKKIEVENQDVLFEDNDIDSDRKSHHEYENEFIINAYLLKLPRCELEISALKVDSIPESSKLTHGKHKLSQINKYKMLQAKIWHHC